jgi:hypothetical protein
MKFDQLQTPISEQLSRIRQPDTAGGQKDSLIPIALRFQALLTQGVHSSLKVSGESDFNATPALQQAGG